jgi:ribose 1,5-bisphosphokinase
MAQDGAFCLHWSAHGLSYGLPADVLRAVQTGTDCLANLSRSGLPEATRVFPSVTVLNLTATPVTLARRLTGRGRENAAEIAGRLAQAGKPLPDGLDVITLSNDDALEGTIAAARRALQPVRV